MPSTCPVHSPYLVSVSSVSPEPQGVSLSHFTDEEMKARGLGDTPNSWDTDLSPDPRLFPLQSACPVGNGSRGKKEGSLKCLHSKTVAKLSFKDSKREEGRREMTAQMEGAAPSGSHQAG